MTALTTRPPTSSDHALLDHDDCNSASCLHDHGPKRAVVFDPSALLSGRNVTIVKGGRKLISGIDIALRSAEIVTLIGPNGAGKTTLVRALLGLEPLETGTVTRQPGLIVGYVPQRFDIDRTIPLTVSRFLNLGLRKSPRELTAALDDVGAARLENSQVAELSGGELQRVILARALLRNPHLLVLDEPARGVDHIGEADLYALIARLRDTRGFGVLLVSHDLHIVMANADRVVCINGHVCCSGRPDTVAQHPEYARLFGPQAARAFAVYTHHHDHDHDMAGTPVAKSLPRSEPNSRV
jgi:zinc transport system ATP-binding protein